MTTTTLQALIFQASTELGSDACQAGKHTWASEGGRPCPHDLTDNCGQAFYRCSICGAHDYGEAGGPGDADCARTCQHRTERELAIINAKRDPLGHAFYLHTRERLSRVASHRALLRALLRQPKPKLP